MANNTDTSNKLSCRKKLYLFLFSVILLLSITLSTNVYAAPKPVISTSQKQLAIGDSFVLSLKNTDKFVHWSSSRRGLLKLKRVSNNKIRLTGIRSGSTKFKLWIKGSKKYTCKINVYDPVTVKCSLSESAGNCTQGDTVKISFTGTDKKAKWSFSDPSLIEITKQGKRYVKFKAINPGSLTVTLKNGRYLKHTIKLQIRPRQKKVALLNHPGYVTYLQVMVHQMGLPCDIVDSCNVKDYDALIIPGGPDITANHDSVLDIRDFTALDQFVKAGKPVLGVCRGMQVINVYFGGDLVPHIDGHQGWNIRHGVSGTAGSWITNLYGTSFQVNSYHHQCVRNLGSGLTADVYSTGDQRIEAIHHRSLPVYGVQWHPEEMGQTNLIRFFTNQIA